MIDEEIAVALQLVKEKTGIEVPDIFGNVNFSVFTKFCKIILTDKEN